MTGSDLTSNSGSISLDLTESGRFAKWFKVTKELGEGEDGKTLLVKSRVDRQYYAIKLIDYTPEKQPSGGISEYMAMAHLDHPNIIRYFYAWVEMPNEDGGRTSSALGFERFKANTPLLMQSMVEAEQNQMQLSATTSSPKDSVKSKHSSSSHSSSDKKAFEEAPEKTVYILMAHCEGESLADRCSPGKLDRHTYYKWGTQLISAIEYLHSKNFCHGDLHEGNVMIEASTDKVILIDFGSSCPLDSAGEGTGSVGASHGLHGENRSVKSDIYMLGALLWNVQAGAELYDQKLEEENMLLNSMMDLDRDKRPTLHRANEYFFGKFAKDASMEQLGAKLMSQENDIGEMRGSLKKLEAMVVELGTKVKNQKDEIEGLKTNIKELETKNKNQKNEIEGLKANIKKHKRHKK